jgi:phosphohistidine phosphatase
MSVLLLVHHGDAVPSGVDPMRPLSSAGRDAAERLALAVSTRGVKPAAVWHSGKLRARQTAELFWRACNPLASFSAQRGLQPDDPPNWIRDQIAGDTRSILIVGHMPHLPRLLAALLGEPEGSPRAAFPAHGCVALEADEGRWRELWKLRPDDQ